MKTFLLPLWKYWYLVLVCTVLAAVLAAWQDATRYESRARLLYKLGDEFLQAGAGPDGRTSGRIQLAEAMNTDAQILTSYNQYEKTVQKLGLNSFADGSEPASTLRLEDVVADLRVGLNVRSVENSAVIHLTYEHEDPARAKLVLATLIDVYLAERERILGYNDVNVIEVALQQAREEFFASRDAQQNFIRTDGAGNVESDLSILRNRLATLASKRMDTRRELLEDEQRLMVVETEIERQPLERPIYSESRASSAVEQAQNRLVELRVSEKQLLGKYTDSSRPVSRVRSEIAELERILESERSLRSLAIERTGNNPIRESLEIQRSEIHVRAAGTRSRIATLEEQEGELRSALLALEQRDIQSRNLEYALQTAESRFRNLEEKYLDQKILFDTVAARDASVQVIETPALPTTTTGLSRMNRAMLGAFVGFLVGWIVSVWIQLLTGSAGVSRRLADRREDGLGRAFLVDAEGELVRDYKGSRQLMPTQAARASEDLPVLGKFQQVSVSN